MSEKSRKYLSPRGGVEGESVSIGSEELATETLERPSPAGVNEEIRGTVTVLADIEKVVSLQAEHARIQTARLAEAQNELVNGVGSVRDLADMAAGVTQKIHVGSLAVESDLRPAARGVILLARILRQINGLSNTTAAAIESQTATTRALVEIVGDAARVSTHLAGKLTLLAEETRTVLPTLCNMNLVQAELECLTGELQKVAAEFRCGSGGVSEAGVNVATPHFPAKPQRVH
jgi:methyl-accepting chemotaxis protein